VTTEQGRRLLSAHRWKDLDRDAVQQIEDGDLVESGTDTDHVVHLGGRSRDSTDGPDREIEATVRVRQDG
jgi:hypothetical protein